jgi:HAD superfamily hydrolase (TIGR01509 family)
MNSCDEIIFEFMKYGIEHIIFDLGGVLLNIDMAKISNGFAQVMHSNEAEVKRVKLELVPAYETGKIGTEEFLNGLYPNLKAGYGKQDIITIWNSIILDMPKERLEMLKALRRNYKVHLLSNINDLHAVCFEENFMKWFGTDPRIYFDQYFYSHQIGKRKPDTSTYAWVLEQLGTEPEKAVFIDDMPENIEGARNVGINAYQLMNQKNDIIHLIKELGFLAA